MAALIGISSPKDPGADPKTSGFTVQIPLDLLSEDGVPPQTNDSVSFSVDGTVQSADDENAMVKIESVNGQPVDDRVRRRHPKMLELAQARLRHRVPLRRCDPAWLLALAKAVWACFSANHR